MDAPLLVEEEIRIKTLHDMQVLDTPPEERFDRITKIAQIIFDVPIALVSLVDSNRQWFKSCAGLSAKETPRSMSFCSHAIYEQELMTINDATKDIRFLDNPLVTGVPYIRFYAGKPIRAPNNQMLGTLCIIDTKPRDFSKADKSILSDLAKWVESEFKNLSLTNSLQETAKRLENAQQDLLKQNQNLEQEVKVKAEQLKNERISVMGTMASRIAHDLKNPLQVLQITSDFLRQDLEKHMDDKMRLRCSTLQNSIVKMNRLIDDVLNFVKTSSLNIETCFFSNLFRDSTTNIIIPPNISVILPQNDSQFKCDAKKMEAVFSNLFLNSIQAIGYSGEIKIILVDSSEKVSIIFEDSGPGIPENVLPRIFEPLFTTKSSGTGLGLGICLAIIKQHHGTLNVKNNPTRFIIELPKSLTLN
ncbi:GAF domain-containing sensor histidine kinase [Candidatus Nitrosarchaeum limnium]|jgi:signal transduction histidine kinase|uniref:ATPase/histidine kinase/DNA gyrase B/HSP90 domain protein n=1 Tax=Candidatus Nitrosarchaeum limnium BG20 TaxID=859192 RepID=S2E675_9ARCH|nr:GAF domain-containing sensor histidine kinase [Candidatus Nitrosarchaeum limnium]EPA06665.1 ATPase/histidine kinase/DNA gyrase B/HSP90 domain protein [Candidatus Nitrosarchaeum limnium BG20]